MAVGRTKKGAIKSGYHLKSTGPKGKVVKAKPKPKKRRKR
jgi:hypothetical protein